MKKYFDTTSILVIVITFILFIAALFTKGFTQDLLLEAGVLLISVKLIMMAYKTGVYYNNMSNDLKQILEILSNENKEKWNKIDKK
jgi:hypothetical protein